MSDEQEATASSMLALLANSTPVDGNNLESANVVPAISESQTNKNCDEDIMREAVQTKYVYNIGFYKRLIFEH
jgi:hypothetical protein